MKPSQLISQEQLLGWVVPDRDVCRQAAQEMLMKDPNRPREQLATEVIAFAKRKAATVGGATGAISSPVSMLPAALADIIATLKIEGTMAGTVAALLDPASLDDPEAFRADVVSIIFPGAVSQALRQVGIRAGEQLTRTIIRKAATQGFLETLVRITTRLMGGRLSRKAVIGHGIPLVGIGIGAGWNWLEVSAVGARAIAYHTGQPMPTARWAAQGRRLIAQRFGRLRGKSQPPHLPPPIPNDESGD